MYILPVIKIYPFQDPCEVYALVRSRNSILLESQKHGAHSYIALDPSLIFKSKGDVITLTTGDVVTTQTGNPLAVLQSLLQPQIERTADMPLFYGGCIGYIGYDVAHFFETLPRTVVDDVCLSDIYMIFPQVVIHFDHEKGVMEIIADSEEKIRYIHSLCHSGPACLVVRIDPESCIIPRSGPSSGGHVCPHPELKKYNQTKFVSNFSREEYVGAIEECKRYIRQGDSFQVKLSQRFSCPIQEDGFAIYKRLRAINPSPYASFCDLDDCTIVSCSPEHLVKVENGIVETRPIGGTYPRGATPQDDRKLAQQFLDDPKEKAEHTMLIDLERNDLGKVCVPGSIHVNEMMQLETYSHLMHIVTNIKGKLQHDKDIFAVLRAMFPGGTVTGCPKIQTMKIIDELEPTARVLYTGSIGFMNYSNDMDFNIIIRTLVIQDGVGYIQVGGGIVADSDPEKEYEETLDKAKALFESIEHPTAHVTGQGKNKAESL